MSIVFSHSAGLQDEIMLYEVMHCKGKVKSKTNKKKQTITKKSNKGVTILTFYTK